MLLWGVPLLFSIRHTYMMIISILLTKTTAALTYHKLHGLYFLAVVFVRSIDYKYSSVRKVLGETNFKRNKMIQNRDEMIRNGNSGFSVC